LRFRGLAVGGLAVIAAALKHMFAAGMSQEQILAAVEDMEQSGQGIAPSSNAKRCARYRDRKACQPMSKHVEHVNDTLKEAPHTPPQENNIIYTNTKAKKGSRLPENWQPSSESQKYGEKLGFSAFEVASMAEDLRLWAHSAAGQVAVKRDWESAFKGWMRREKAKKATQPAKYGKVTPIGSHRNYFKPEPEGPKISEEERQRNLAKLTNLVSGTLKWNK
jgi:hypothetical protein